MFFAEFKDPAGERRGLPLAGNARGKESLRDLITLMLAEDAEKWSEVHYIGIQTNGRFAEAIDAPEDVKREIAERLEIEEPCDMVVTVPRDLVKWAIDIPGAATLAMTDPTICRFIVYTERRIFGNSVAADGRPSVVVVPRYPGEE